MLMINGTIASDLLHVDAVIIDKHVYNAFMCFLLE